MKYTSYSFNLDEEKSQFIILWLSCFLIICVSKLSLLVSSLSLFFTFMIYVMAKRNMNRKYFIINFTENQIEIEYTKRTKKININYTDILHLRYTRYKATRYNELSYLENNKIKKVSFLTVADQDEYINFLKWIREKNSNIEFDAYPPDEHMEFKIQETFGFKYRKFLKDSQ